MSRNSGNITRRDFFSMAVGASLVGFSQNGVSAVTKTEQEKTRESINIKDFGAVGDGLTDDTEAIQAAIDHAKSQASFSVDSTSINYGSRAVIFPPAVYLTSGTLLCDADVSLYCETFGGAVIKYTGTAQAIVVSTAFVGEVRLAPKNTRVFDMCGITIFAKRASHGVLLGSATQRHLSISRGQIYGPQYGIYCGEAVYFLHIKNMDIRNCNIGLFVDAYCDLLTVDDRCLFNSNRVTDMVLKCPTYNITNNDFEGGHGATAAIKLFHDKAANAELRAGVIFANRFGPESPHPAAPPYLYDIWIYDNGVKGAMDGVKILYNTHASYTDARQKSWPIYIDGKTKRLNIDGNTYSGYSSLYVGGNTTKAFATGVVSGTNFINNIYDASDDFKALFANTNTKNVEPYLAASAITKNYAVRLNNYSSSSGFTGESVAILVASSPGSNYRNFAGIALHSGVAGRIIWIAKTGAILETTLDASVSALYDPVYLQNSGSLGLIVANTPFSLGKVLTTTANAKILVSSTNPS